jgi:hypothetical protein
MYRGKRQKRGPETASNRFDTETTERKDCASENCWIQTAKKEAIDEGKTRRRGI